MMLMRKVTGLIVPLASLALVACGGSVGTSVDDRVSKLETQVADTGDDARITALETQLADLQVPTEAADEEAVTEGAEVLTYGDLVVGFSQIGAVSNWVLAETASIKTTADELGVHLLFSDGQDMQENQFRAIRSFMDQDVDVIVVNPMVSAGWEPVFQEAKDAGIPIILVGRVTDVPDDLYATRIGYDFVLEGENACEAMANLLDEVGKIVELQGTIGSYPATDRGTGFANCLEGYENMEIIASESGNFTRAEGKEVMEAFLQIYGADINGVYAHNDDMAIGAIRAIEEYGLVPGEDIKIVSIDGVIDAFDAMAAGQLNCTVEHNPFIGPLLIDTALALASGEDLPHLIIVSEGEVYCEDVAADLLPDRQY